MHKSNIFSIIQKPIACERAAISVDPTENQKTSLQLYSVAYGFEFGFGNKS